jgi:signal peptidase I
MFEFLVSVLTVMLLCGLVSYFLTRTFLYIITVQGGSMYPTLVTGDRVLVLRHWPAHWLKRGQILVGIPPYPFSYKGEDTLEQLFIIKRVIGLPGDTVVTYILDLPEFERATQISHHSNDGQRIWNVPLQHVFVKGDSIGTDSLIWGPLPFGNVIGIFLLKLPRKDVSADSSRALPNYSEDTGYKEE